MSKEFTCDECGEVDYENTKRIYKGLDLCEDCYGREKLRDELDFLPSGILESSMDTILDDKNIVKALKSENAYVVLDEDEVEVFKTLGGIKSI